MATEIDFADVGDPTLYVTRHNVSRDTVEDYLSSGVLFPDEVKLAMTMLRIISRTE